MVSRQTLYDVTCLQALCFLVEIATSILWRAADGCVSIALKILDG